MSIKDIIKDSYQELDNFVTNFSVSVIVKMLLTILVALIFGLLIALIYHKLFKGVVYNHSFSITLVGMTVLTSIITLAISSNLIVSLGMVGALSIVRFRTAIKEPEDLMYLFWAITVGICAGSGMYPLCVIAVLVMLVILLIMRRHYTAHQVYIVVVHYNDAFTLDEVKQTMSNMKYRIKSRTSRGDKYEVAMEVALSNSNLVFADKLSLIEGVTDVTAIQYDGEYHE